MLPSESRYFLGNHLQAHGFYDIRDNGVLDDFIQKCSPDLILMLRLYEVELGNTLTGEIIGQLFITYKTNCVSTENSLGRELP
ncbi:unnamed protein product [Rotaria sp. Silwood2]|nr:unnamed protein product [Rotaria sp. Silwood2]CAF4494992.1 unnamed protein product [Rotaria sp. Silwood2]